MWKKMREKMRFKNAIGQTCEKNAFQKCEEKKKVKKTWKKKEKCGKNRKLHVVPNLK